MPSEVHHWSILTSMRIWLEYLIYVLLSIQNVYLCGQKLAELIKNSRYIYYCTFKRYIYRKNNSCQNLWYLVYI